MLIICQFFCSIQIAQYSLFFIIFFSSILQSSLDLIQILIIVSIQAVYVLKIELFNGIFFSATIVKDFRTFWTDVTSAPISSPGKS